MALVASGQGFADWQHQTPADDQPFQYSGAPHVGPFTLSPFFVSRWLAVGGAIVPGLHAAAVTFTWYADQALLQPIGARRFVLDPAVASGGVIAGFKFHFVNLGPWLTVGIDPGAGNQSQYTMYLFGTQRMPATEVNCSVSVPVDQQNVNVPASSNVVVNPLDYFAGPAHWWFNVAGQNLTVSLQVQTAVNVWDYIFQRLVNAGTQADGSVVLPLGAWRAVLTNATGVAATAFLAVVPSVTGAD